jgi:uncharacterized repeat protein (TIGR03803 family)
MKKLRTCAAPTFAAARGRKGDSVGKLRLSTVACAVFVFCVAAVIASPAQTVKTLVNFDGANGSGALFMSPVQGTDGNFYGTTSNGGTSRACYPFGCGTVFKITAEGKLTTLHSFDNTDGANPWAGLVQARNGDFYGTTTGSGANDYGTVFKITPGGKLTSLYSFCSLPNCTDGLNPASTLVQATDGDFYGATSAYYGNGLGTVFKITPGGKLTTLHSFCSEPNCTDGRFPVGGLVQATNGDLYGTTAAVGAIGCGTVFRMSLSGKLTTLHSFDGTDGCGPYATLVQANDGDFYGITIGGGANEYGTVFKITPGGKLTSLYSFCSLPNCTDGYYPWAGLVQATDRNFYGTTYGGGANDYGTVFSISRKGRLTTLHSFDNKDGTQPVGGLLQATNGNFYGATPVGGAHDYGTAFRLSVGLGPFVTTRPNSGKVGTKVIILGNKLTGTTSVTFNGTAAVFKIVSSTEVTTTVPIGATTGKVQVKTPSGTLTSNVNFQVAS